jgi:hypothetical protein
MAGYLLLRDNKESGPFTMDDLLNFGLKPYDLIWVQGKSAAWRYPSEIEELKAFAPVVEEQPFDRFFKKNTVEETSDEPPRVAEQYSRYTPVPQEVKEEPKFKPKKSVFVTLPGQEKIPLKKNSQPVPEKPIPAPVPLATTPTISVTENPAAAEIKYSQPLDEIKERYVKTLLERKDKKAKKGFVINILKKAAVFGGLIVLGVVAGFMIRSKPGKENTAVRDMIQAPGSLVNSNRVNEPIQDGSLLEENSPAALQHVETASDVQYTTPGEKNGTTKFNDEQPTLKIRKETMLIVPKKREDFSRADTPGAGINTITGERERKIRDNADSERPLQKSGKTSLKDFVSVSSNDYKRVAFGGIRNLYLTVTNNSKFELDNVIVELQYLKPSEEPLRTENINFKSIGPDASATIKIPDTNRGIKVSYRIISIDSKQVGDVAAGM